MSNPSPVHALSTMWSQGRFPHKDRDSMTRFAETASQLGFPAVEINYVIPPEGVEELLASNHVSIASLHSPTPRVKTADGRWSEALHLGGIEPGGRAEMFGSEKRLRRLFDEGVRPDGRPSGRAGEEVEALRRQAHAERREGAGRNLSQARRSLAEMAEHAAGSGGAIGLEDRFHYHEFPGPDGRHELLARV